MPADNLAAYLDSVGALLRSRTKDVDGVEVGHFDDNTRPTGDQVSELAIMALGEVQAAVGVEIRESLLSALDVVVSYRTAMLVELSYFPEQVAQNRSPYEHLRLAYERALETLVSRANDVTPGEGPGTPSPPSYSFPLANTLEVVLGPLPGGYVIPYGEGSYQ